MKYFLLTLCCLFLILAGCKDSINEPGLPDTGDNYPVAIGNMWQYQMIGETTFYPEDSASYTVVDTVEASVSITGTETFPGDIQTYIFETIEHQGIYDNSSLNFYRIQPEGFYSYAYSGAGTLAQPKARAQTTYVINGHRYNSLSHMRREIEFPLPEKSPADTVIIENSPPFVLKYPLTLNSRWTYRRAYAPFKIEKKVTGIEYLTRQGRMYNCYLVRWIYDMDNNGVEDENIVLKDHISGEGMIERNIFVTGIMIVGQDMQPQGKIDMHTRYVLTDIKIIE